MALKLGTENKRQVYIATGLFAVVIIGGIYEISTYFGGSSTPPPRTVPVETAASANHPTAGVKSGSQGAEAQKLTNEGLDPSLHFDKLAESEAQEYVGTGRNIFSAESAPPVKIEQAIAPGRPNLGAPTIVAQTGPPPPPKPPPIDLKYFGYALSKDKSIRGFFTLRDDIFVAKSGEIVDHRYKVGTILPTGAEVTDLGYNNTETLKLTTN